MSRLTWAKAKPALAGQFADWPDQWPQRLAPVHLARLQAPPNGKDWSLTLAFDEAITGACTAGELAHEMAAFVFPPVAFGCDLEDTPAQRNAKWLAQRTTRKLPAVTAADFVAWLGKQGETPSAHIAAWREATGEAPDTAPTAPQAVSHAGTQRNGEGKRPDWSLWLALPQVKVWQAVALSLDMDPDAMVRSPHAWMAGPGGATLFERRSFADEAQAAEFEKRRRVAAASLAGGADNDTAEGPLPVFVALALRRQWAMPDELRALESVAPPELAVPLMARLRDLQAGTVLRLPAGTTTVPFADLAHLIADALWPEQGPEDERTVYAGARVGLDDELQRAVDSGALRVLDPLTLGPHPFPHGAALRDSVVHVDDLAEWLRQSRRMVVQIGELAEPTNEAPGCDRGLRVKREALIDRNVRRWPTIERDLKDGSSNALSASAKADGIGFWWEGDALKWAEARGKLTAPDAAASLASVMHRLHG